MSNSNDLLAAAMKQKRDHIFRWAAMLFYILHKHGLNRVCVLQNTSICIHITFQNCAVSRTSDASSSEVRTTVLLVLLMVEFQKAQLHGELLGT
jgi:hypothetical protein